MSQDLCENPQCVSLRRYAWALMKQNNVLHRRAQFAEGIMDKAVTQLRKTGGIHEGLVRDGLEGRYAQRAAEQFVDNAE